MKRLAAAALVVLAAACGKRTAPAPAPDAALAHVERRDVGDVCVRREGGFLADGMRRVKVEATITACGPCDFLSCTARVDAERRLVVSTVLSTTSPPSPCTAASLLRAVCSETTNLDGWNDADLLVGAAAHRVSVWDGGAGVEACVHGRQ